MSRLHGPTAELGAHLSLRNSCETHQICLWPPGRYSLSITLSIYNKKLLGKSNKKPEEEGGDAGAPVVVVEDKSQGVFGKGAFPGAHNTIGLDGQQHSSLHSVDMLRRAQFSTRCLPWAWVHVGAVMTQLSRTAAVAGY